MRVWVERKGGKRGVDLALQTLAVAEYRGETQTCLRTHSKAPRNVDARRILGLLCPWRIRHRNLVNRGGCSPESKGVVHRGFVGLALGSLRNRLLRRRFRTHEEFQRVPRTDDLAKATAFFCFWIFVLVIIRCFKIGYPIEVQFWVKR